MQGKSDRPVYLLLHHGTAEVRDASHLWGLGTINTRESLKAEFGESIRIVAIGPAGLQTGASLETLGLGDVATVMREEGLLSD